MLIFGCFFQIKTNAYLRIMLFILMLFVAFISLQSFGDNNSLMGSSKGPSFVLPVGWRLDPSKKLTKRASTLEYSYSGAKTDPFVPMQLFSTYVRVDSALSQSQSDALFISSYVEACIAGRITQTLFSESIGDVILGGFKCTNGDKNNILAIYLVSQRDYVNHNLIFIWDEKESKIFTDQDIKIRLGYALQSGMQYLICKNHSAKCSANDNEKYINAELNSIYRSISKYNPKFEPNVRNHNSEYLTQSYRLHLAIFGFAPHIGNQKEEKCFTILKPNEVSAIKICQGYTNQLESHADNVLINKASYPLLKKIIVEKQKPAIANNICDLGQSLQLTDEGHPSVGIIKEQQWFACKVDDVILSIVGVVRLSISPETRIQYHWNVPDSVKQNFELFKIFVMEEQLKESLNLYLCDEKSYLHACSIKN